MTNPAPSKARVLRRSRGKLHPETKPIVLEYHKKEKKNEDSETKRKPKYSKNLENIQTLEEDLLRISQKAAKAFSKGIDTYQQEREKSAQEKTDGAVEDFVHNSAKAMSVSMKEVSDIPIDIAEAVDKESYRKRLRQSLRDVSKAIDFWSL
jgi:hypothetical protein